jgi:hypothetical protein
MNNSFYKNKKTSYITNLFSKRTKKQPSLNYQEMVLIFEEKIKKDL